MRFACLTDRLSTSCLSSSFAVLVGLVRRGPVARPHDTLRRPFVAAGPAFRHAVRRPARPAPRRPEFTAVEKVDAESFRAERTVPEIGDVAGLCPLGVVKWPGDRADRSQQGASLPAVRRPFAAARRRNSPTAVVARASAPVGARLRRPAGPIDDAAAGTPPERQV